MRGDERYNTSEIEEHGHDLRGAHRILMSGHQRPPEEGADDIQREEPNEQRMGTTLARGSRFRGEFRMTAAGVAYHPVVGANHSAAGASTFGTCFRGVISHESGMIRMRMLGFGIRKKGRRAQSGHR